MGQAYLCGFVIAQGHHIGITVGYMTQVPDAEFSSDVMEQSQDIGLLRVQITAFPCNFLGTAGSGPAVVSSGAGVAAFRFRQN